VVKITSKQIDRMKKLRAKGLSIDKISIRMKINRDTILYHLNDNYREYRKNISRKINKRYYKNKKRRKAKLLYQKNYFKNRYKIDKEFRDKQIQWAKNYRYKKMKEQDERRN
jgi:hypothetical protein